MLPTRGLCLLRGEDLELPSRELGVTAASLSGWRDDSLAAGQAALKSRPTDDRDDEIAQLRSKVGELTMDSELLLRRLVVFRWPCCSESSSNGTIIPTDQVARVGNAAGSSG